MRAAEARQVRSELMRHAFSAFQIPQVCFKTFCQFLELLPVFQARMQEEMPDGRTSPALQRLKRCTRAAAPPRSIDGTAMYRFSTLTHSYTNRQVQLRDKRTTAHRTRASGAALPGYLWRRSYNLCSQDRAGAQTLAQEGNPARSGFPGRTAEDGKRKSPAGSRRAKLISPATFNTRPEPRAGHR